MRYIKNTLLKSSIALLVALSASQNINAENTSTNTPEEYSPTAEQMILDGLIYRPLSLAATAIGTGIFIVTLPFSLLGGNSGQAGEKLVLEPAAATFTKCLGCIGHYRKRN